MLFPEKSSIAVQVFRAGPKKAVTMTRSANGTLFRPNGVDGGRMRITAYIRNDLRARVRSGAGLPDKLTLAGLSDFYRVSPMPVRAAVAGLIDEGYFQKQENGRLAVNPAKLGAAPDGAAEARAEPPTDWQRVLRDDVIRRSLRGQAVPLRIAATAERLGIGRTLVHSIFHRLAGAGLLEHAPRRGWRVRPFRQADLDAYQEVRELLELRALELAAPRLEPAALRELLEQNVPGRGRRPTRFDNGLHRYWVERSQNRYIADFFDRHGAYFAALLDYAALGEPLLSELAGQHRAILEALLHKKWRQARECLVRDIRRLRPILKDTIRRLGAEGGDSPPEGKAR
jgi:DNA-binding GntR family transcriptional regulator